MVVLYQIVLYQVVSYQVVSSEPQQHPAFQLIKTGQQFFRSAKQDGCAFFRVTRELGCGARALYKRRGFRSRSGTHKIAVTSDSLDAKRQKMSTRPCRAFDVVQLQH
jgi:hypothetical protein